MNDDVPVYRIRYCDEHHDAVVALGGRENWEQENPYDFCGVRGCRNFITWIEKPFNMDGTIKVEEAA